MPAAGMDIARETRSIEQALGWTALAGPLLPKVIDHGIYRRSKPADYTRAQLARIMALDDRAVIGRLTTVGKPARDALLSLRDADLVGLARGVSETDLDSLGGYLTGLQPDRPRAAADDHCRRPERGCRPFRPPRIRDAVLSSADQLAAVEMMLRADKGLDLATIRRDAELVLDSKVSPLLLWEKHPIAVAGAGIAGLVLLLLLMRLFSRPRARRMA